MHASAAVLFLAAAASAAVLEARNMPFGVMARDVSATGGWSLQASTCPSDTSSCGSGSCCPSGLSCATAANDEVAACCPADNADCRGAIEGAPVCADSTWSLYIGFMGNGFCCASGMVGQYTSSDTVAGTCVQSVAADATSASLASSASATATKTSSSSSSTSTSTEATTTSSSSSSASSSTSASTTSSASSSASSTTASASASGTGAAGQLAVGAGSIMAGLVFALAL